ncbi:MAG: cell wall hydrolase [Rhodovibrionaceae bacterium]|nr:cell wall hydrolase [Rhodovibrionaceae bacterium]
MMKTNLRHAATRCASTVKLLPGITVIPALALAAWLMGALATPASAQYDVHEEIYCLALTIYFEARGEKNVGKVAVGHVVMNRAADRKFPRKICDVVRQGGESQRYRCQFSWWCDGLSDKPSEIAAWEEAQALARRIFWGFSDDPTEGALWYHADYVKPVWRHKLHRGVKIGQHIFYIDPHAVEENVQLAENEDS